MSVDTVTDADLGGLAHILHNTVGVNVIDLTGLTDLEHVVLTGIVLIGKEEVVAFLTGDVYPGDTLHAAFIALNGVTGNDLGNNTIPVKEAVLLSGIGVDLIDDLPLLGLESDLLTVYGKVKPVPAVRIGGASGLLGGGAILTIDIPVNISLPGAFDNINQMDLIIHTAEAMDTVTHLQCSSFANEVGIIGYVIDLAIRCNLIGPHITLIRAGGILYGSKLSVGQLNDIVVTCNDTVVMNRTCAGNSNNVIVIVQLYAVAHEGIQLIHKGLISGLDDLLNAVNSHVDLVNAICIGLTLGDLVGGIPLSLYVISDLAIEGTADDQNVADTATGVGQTVDTVTNTQVGIQTLLAADVGIVDDLTILSHGMLVGTVAITIGGEGQAIDVVHIVPGTGRATAGGQIDAGLSADQTLIIKLQGHQRRIGLIDGVCQCLISAAQCKQLTILGEGVSKVAQIIGFTGRGLQAGAVHTIDVHPDIANRLIGLDENVRNVALGVRNDYQFVFLLDGHRLVTQQCTTVDGVDLGLFGKLQIKVNTQEGGCVVGMDNIALYALNEQNTVIVLIAEVFDGVNLGNVAVFIEVEAHGFHHVDLIDLGLIIATQFYLFTIATEGDVEVAVGTRDTTGTVVRTGSNILGTL